MALSKVFKLFIFSFSVFWNCSSSHEKINNEVEAEQSNLAHAVITDQFIDGQPIEYYLNSSEMDKIVRDYYDGKIIIREDEKTGNLLNTLIEKEGDLVPFYYRCFMNICKNNSAQLQNYLGIYCIKLLEEKTYYCVKKLRQGAPDYYTGLVANEIYKNEDWDAEINNISVRLHLNLENESPELRKELDLFIVGLKNDIEHLAHPQ